MNVTVYTMPNCVQCEQTKRFFDQKNVKYDTVDISTDAEAYKKVTEMGFKSAPIVITDKDTWSGFRLEKLHSTVSLYSLNN